jgi:hypothetical protein
VQYRLGRDAFRAVLVARVLMLARHRLPISTSLGLALLGIVVCDALFGGGGG